MSRLPWIPLERALELGRDMGIPEAPASRGAFRMIAHHPELAERLYGLLTTLMTRNTLPLRLRELLVMRIAWVTRSEYAWFQHYGIATGEVGLPPSVVLAVRNWRASKELTGADRAVLAAVDDTLRDGSISDTVWAECAREIEDPAMLVELVVAIGNWNMFSQIFRTLKVPLQEGAVAWPPDGIAPQ